MPRAKNKMPRGQNPSAPSSPLTKSDVASATGQPYGQNEALQNAVAAVPTSPTAPAPTPTPTGVPDPARTAATLDAAKSFVPQQIGLGAPTGRPGESLMTPPSAPLVPTGRLSDTLAAAAAASNSSSLLELAKRAQALGQ